VNDCRHEYAYEHEHAQNPTIARSRRTPAVGHGVHQLERLRSQQQARQAQRTPRPLGLVQRLRVFRA